MTLHHSKLAGRRVDAVAPGGVRLGANFRTSDDARDDGENVWIFRDRYGSHTGDDGQVTRDIGWWDQIGDRPAYSSQFPDANGDLRLGGVARDQTDQQTRFVWSPNTPAAGTVRLRVGLAHNPTISWVYAFTLIGQDAADRSIGSPPPWGTEILNIPVGGVNGQAQVCNVLGQWKTPANWIADYESDYVDLSYPDRGADTGILLWMSAPTNWYAVNHFSFEEI